MAHFFFKARNSRVGLVSLWVTLFFIWQGNPIYSILSLIAASLGLGYQLYQLGSEFIAVLVVLVYVGAVTVLFLFVVMMINFRVHSNSLESYETFFFWGVTSFYLLDFEPRSTSTPVGFNPLDVTNFGGFGQLLYNTDHNSTVVVTGLILLVGMISSICLTYVNAQNYRSQHAWTQINSSNSVFVYR